MLEIVRDKSEALVTEANTLVEQGKVRQATSIYIEAIKSDLTNYRAFYHLGWCLFKQNRLSEAASFYHYTIDADPQFSQAYFALGELLSQQKQFKQAISYYLKSIKLHPNQFNFYMGLGKALKAIGSQEQALSCFQKVINLKPNFLWAYIQSGAIWRQQGDYQKAVECYIQAIQINPNFQAAYTILEFIPIAEEQLDKLIDVYQKIVEQNSQIYQAWANLGDALTQKKQLDKALEAYQQACYYKTIKAYPQIAQSYLKTINKREPAFIIIGAGKCGTTSLFQYLSQHPQILPPINKEIDFFNFNFTQGSDWYLAHFPTLPDEQKFITGEASPSYFSYLHVERRLYELFPQTKIIILLRNPVARVFSHYHHKIREGAEKRSLEAALNSELNAIRQATEAQLSYIRGYLGISMYVYKLKRWLSLFPKERVLILKSEDLYENPAATMSETCNFLNIAELKAIAYNRHNSGAYKLQDDKLKQQLKIFFRGYNQQLETFLDRQFDWD